MSPMRLTMLVMGLTTIVARPGGAQQAAPGGVPHVSARADTIALLAVLSSHVEESVEAYAGRGSMRGRTVDVSDALQAAAFRGLADRHGFALRVSAPDSPVLRCASERSLPNAPPMGISLLLEIDSLAQDRAVVSIAAMCLYYHESGPTNPYVYSRTIELHRWGTLWIVAKVRWEAVT